MRSLVFGTLSLLIGLPAYASNAKFIQSATAELVPNRYIVVYKDSAPGLQAATMARDLASTHGARIQRQFQHALNASVMTMSEKAAQTLARDSRVAYVEQVAYLYINTTQTNPTWGLDRIDQTNRPLDDAYTYDYDGTGVNVYVIDTGIRTTHNDFEGRARFGANFVNTTEGDDQGHGTHVAGTVGGATYGVAKNATLWGVKVCNSRGQCPTDDIVAGVNYVTAANPGGPKVANMSLGGGKSAAIDDAVEASIAAGVFYAVAAGNDRGRNACGLSPAGVRNAFTVGSSTISDARSSFSNIGDCVDIFAPGSSIDSTYNSSNTATRSLSGTSMASPHVAGAAALVFQQYPDFTPAQVAAELTARASPDVLSNVGNGSPNLLLNIRESGAPPPPPPPPPADCTPLEDFEGTASGWVTDSASTCTTGDYVVGNPTQQSNGGVVTQPGGSQDGNSAMFTAANSSVGRDDVDGGNCILSSPSYAVSEASTLSVWYFHGQRDTGDDPNGDFFSLEVSTDGGATWTTMASNGDSASSATWTEATADLPAGVDVSLRMQCSDGAGGGDLIECGIDNVALCVVP